MQHAVIMVTSHVDAETMPVFEPPSEVYRLLNRPCQIIRQYKTDISHLCFVV
jgi:hypothetical protein